MKRYPLAALSFVAIAALALAGTVPNPDSIKTSPQSGQVERSGRRFVTVRGEIVDYYCYIEKGLTGPAHHECAIRCVAGDVCMGILTTDDQLYMISVNHIRAMTPLSFEGIPNPFDKCRRLISERVDLTGHAMERKGQKIIEVTDVRKVGEPAAVR